MKKIFSIFVLASLLLSVFVLGQQGSGSSGGQPEVTGQPELTGQGTGEGTQTDTETQQQNKGEETQIQNQVKTQVKSGSLTIENGKQIQVEEKANNKIQLKSGNVQAETGMQMTQQQTQTGTKLQVKLSNGKDSEVKVMPDTASEKALERLRIKVCSEENGCQIELKEVGKGEEVKAAYEVKVQKQAKFLGLFKTKMQVQAQVDAENGEVIQEKKPWWAFLAADAEE
jgi:hypothetical protein